MKLGNSIFIGGDICPTDANASLFSEGAAEDLFGDELLKLFEGSLGLIFNLETPLTDVGAPIPKSGPSLVASPRAVKTLAKLSCVGIGLSNNHILDWGPEGLKETMRVLGDAGLAFFGAGQDEVEAARPLILNLLGKTVGVYACAEHEFTIAGENKPGANPFDALTIQSRIADLAKRVDRTIVLYHGMKEFSRYPSPEVMRRCRAMVEAGASFVACQHSHCVGCEERYQGGIILYGQGDFHFAMGKPDEFRSTGLAVAYDVCANEVEYFPLVSREGVVRLAQGVEKNEILEEFYERSLKMQEPGFVETNWTAFCERAAGTYAEQVIESVSPRSLSILYRIIRRALPKRAGFRSGKDVAALLNILQCEAHNEVLRTELERRMADGTR